MLRFRGIDPLHQVNIQPANQPSQNELAVSLDINAEDRRVIELNGSPPKVFHKNIPVDTEVDLSFLQDRTDVFLPAKENTIYII